jgi:hypothetical protein
MKDVRKHATKEQIKEAWTWKDQRGHQEFQMNVGEPTIYWYGSACCGWYARYEGWSQFLREKGVAGYSWEEKAEKESRVF